MLLCRLGYGRRALLASHAGQDDSELMVSRLALIASRDDYLLEEGFARALDDASASLGGVKPEVLSDDVTPETVAVELRSPSLFSPTRLLVVPDVRSWLGAPRVTPCIKKGRY